MNIAFAGKGGRSNGSFIPDNLMLIRRSWKANWRLNALCCIQSGLPLFLSFLVANFILWLSFRSARVGHQKLSYHLLEWKAFPSSFRNKESKATCDLSSWSNPYFKRKAQIPFSFSRYLLKYLFLKSLR